MKINYENWLDFRQNLMFYLSRALNRPLVAPEYFMISLTDDCNLKCKMCGCWQTAQRYKGEELNTQEIKNIIDEIRSWAKDAEIVFSGGEPFVRNDILELIDYVCRQGIRLSINTNGMLIDRIIADRLAAYPVHHINFSLDGDLPQINDPIRGEGVFSRVLDSVALLNEAKKKYQSRQPFVSFNVTIMKQNISSLLGMISLAKRSDVADVFFQPVVTDNTDIQKREGSVFWGEANIDELLRISANIEAHAKENDIKLHFPRAGLLKDYFMQGVAEPSQRKWKCFVGYSRLSISSNGHIYSCNEEFGEARGRGLREVWHSRKANSIRKQFKRCRKFCLQTCFARPASESLRKIIGSFIRK